MGFHKTRKQIWLEQNKNPYQYTKDEYSQIYSLLI